MTLLLLFFIALYNAFDLFFVYIHTHIIHVYVYIGGTHIIHS